MSLERAKLPTPAWCRRCQAGPYTWRGGLRLHVRSKHSDLSDRERSEIVSSSIQLKGVTA